MPDKLVIAFKCNKYPLNNYARSFYQRKLMSNVYLALYLNHSQVSIDHDWSTFMETIRVVARLHVTCLS